MSKFKIGDRVRLRNDFMATISRLRGQTGVLVARDTRYQGPGRDDGHYEIVFDDQSIDLPSPNMNWRVHDEQLELVENGIEWAIKCLK